MRRYEISDQAWERFCDLLPGKPTDVGRRAKDTAACSSTSCSGLPAAALSGETFPNASAPGTLSANASTAGLRRAYGSGSSSNCRNRTWIGCCLVLPPLGLTSTRQDKKTAAQAEALGRSRSVFSTRIHACCDALGNPRRIILSAGQQSDYKQAEALLAADMPGAVVADKGCNSATFARFITEREAEVVIPSSANAQEPRLIDENPYKDHNKIERFFNRIKHYRRIATRYDKTASAFLAFINVACFTTEGQNRPSTKNCQRTNFFLGRSLFLGYFRGK